MMRRLGCAAMLIGACMLPAQGAQADQPRLAEACYRAVLDAATSYALGKALAEAEDPATGHPGIASRIRAILDGLTYGMREAVDAGCPDAPFEALIGCLRSKNDGSGRNVAKAGDCVEQVTGRRDSPRVE